MAATKYTGTVVSFSRRSGGTVGDYTITIKPDGVGGNVSFGGQDQGTTYSVGDKATYYSVVNFGVTVYSIYPL